MEQGVIRVLWQQALSQVLQFPGKAISIWKQEQTSQGVFIVYNCMLTSMAFKSPLFWSHYLGILFLQA